MPARATSGFLVLVAALLGCKACDRAVSALGEAGASEPYWARACVTADARLLAVAGDGWAAIDLDAGRFLQRTERGLTNELRCREATARVHGVSRSIELPSGTVGPEDDSWRAGSPLWTGPDGSTARWQQARDRRGRPTDLPVLVLTPPAGPERRTPMAPSLFGAVGASESGSGSSWVVLPHGQFADGAVALVAGWSITPGRHDWAFFRLEPATGRVTQIGVTRPATATRFLGSPLAGAELSRDGRWHMLLFSTASAVEIVIFDPARVEPVKELAFASGGAPRASWSRGGDRVLLRVEDQGAALQTLRVVHMDSKQEVWKRQVPQLVFAELLPDDSVVYVSSKRSAVRVNRDGTERWRVE